MNSLLPTLRLLRSFSLIFIGFFLFLGGTLPSFAAYDSGAGDTFQIELRNSIGTAAPGNALTINSSGGVFQVNFVILYTGSNNQEATLNLPGGISSNLTASGFVLENYDDPDICFAPNGSDGFGSGNITQTNSAFSFRFKGKGSFCSVILTATYVTSDANPQTAGITYGMAGYTDSTYGTPVGGETATSDSISVTVTNDIAISVATTVDSDADGYIDALDFTFSKSFDNSHFDLVNTRSALTIWGKVHTDGDFDITSLSNNTGTDSALRVNFTDSLFADNSLQAISFLGFTASGDSFTAIATSPQFLWTDGVAPTLTPVTIYSTNANPALAKSGDTITLAFTGSEAFLATPTVTIGGSAATVTSLGSNQYTASRAFTSGDTNGTVAFSIAFSDSAGNAGTAVTATTNSSSVTFDKTAPTATVAYVGTVSVVATISPDESVTITNNGGALTKTFTANGTFTFEFVDDAGNTGSVVATVNSIVTSSDQGGGGWGSSGGGWGGGGGGSSSSSSSTSSSSTSSSTNTSTNTNNTTTNPDTGGNTSSSNSTTTEPRTLPSDIASLIGATSQTNTIENIVLTIDTRSELTALVNQLGATNRRTITNLARKLPASAEYFAEVNPDYALRYQDQLARLSVLAINAAASGSILGATGTNTITHQYQADLTDALIHPETLYVMVPESSTGVVHSRDDRIDAVMQRIDTKTIAILEQAYQKKAITEAEYKAGIDAYNALVLHVSVYAAHSATRSKTEGLAAATKLVASVNAASQALSRVHKPVVTPTTTANPESATGTTKPETQTPEEKPVPTIGDTHSFPRNLALKDTGDDVIALQKILKSFGYFPKDIDTTGYFGTVTQNALKKFAQEVLGIASPTGLLDSPTRTALLALPNPKGY